MIMSIYRKQLPQLDGGLFLTDGGIETDLIFNDGMELPHFAAFDLLKTEKGMAVLRAYYARYASIAKANGVGFILESPTWRASADWGARLGYSADDIVAVNRESMELMHDLRARHETERRRGGQSEQRLQPVTRDRFGCRGRRRRRRVECGLIPADGEQVGARRRVERAADHEAEVARSGRRDHARLGGGDQLVDRCRRVGTVRGQLATGSLVAPAIAHGTYNLIALGYLRRRSGRERALSFETWDDGSREMTEARLRR